MVEVMRRDFSGHHMTQFPITANQHGTTQLMEELSEHEGMNHPEIPNSRYEAQRVDDFLFPSEEEGCVENPITIEEDEGFSEPRLQSANHQDNHRRWRQDHFCAPLRKCILFRTQLLNSSLICN